MDDLPMLVAHFLDRYNDENDKQVEGVATVVMERFLSYAWPGNVRELENVIERGVVLAQQPEITLDLLPQEFQAAVVLPATAALPEGMDLGQALAGMERQLIESALRRTGGVQKRAAALLGLKPTTLNEKIKRLKIRV
jgi:DNA-binding NtrC family response regulator